MQTLEFLINYELEELVKTFGIDKKFIKVANFITNDKDSAEFIRSILEDETFKQPEEGNSIYEIAQCRARHSALTFLIGIVFKKFEGLFESFKDITIAVNDNISMKLWMMTALSHDRGYFSDRIDKGIAAHQQSFNYELLTDDYTDELEPLRWYETKNVLAYTYDDIKQYDVAAVAYHNARCINKKQEDEKVDHGILGGCIVFDEYIKKLKKSKVINKNKELFSIKTCALTIAQHNMFKSSCEISDFEFPNKPDILKYDSTFRISKETPLLLFLSFIDTFECVKKFSQRKNEKGYIKTLTILKKIKVKVEENRILIDYSDLFNYIDKKQVEGVKKCKNKYKDNIKSLNQWTVLCAEFEEDQNHCQILLNN